MNSALDFRVSDKTDCRDRDEVAAIRGGAELAHEALRFCGASGRWICAPRNRLRWRGEHKFMARSLETRQGHERGIWVRCKSGDNGTAWEFQLVPPPVIEDRDLRELFGRLAHWKGDATGLEAMHELTQDAPRVIAEMAADNARKEPDPARKAFIEKVAEKATLVAEQVEAAAPPSPLDMTIMVSKLGAVAARVKERDRRISELQRQKAAREKEIEDLMEDLSTTETVLKQLLDEKAGDTEAAGVQQIMSIMSGSLSV